MSNLTKVQRKVGKSVKQDYSKEQSNKNDRLTWLEKIQDRRKDIRLTMLYKMINEMANVPNKDNSRY